MKDKEYEIKGLEVWQRYKNENETAVQGVRS